MIRKFSLTVIFVAIGFLAASSVYAATPSLSLVATSGDFVQVAVSGDPNSGVMFYYNVGSASGMQVVTLGSTDANGSFSITISASVYGINSGNSAYVVVNSQQSAMQSWPYAVTSGTPSLSQNNLTLGLGQSITVASQGNSTAVYMSSNSNPSAANVQISGTQITVTGNQAGAATLVICYAGTSSNCTNLYVTVQNSSTQTLSFSQNNIALTQGQNASVTVSSGNGTYTVTANSNSSAVATTLTNNVITVYGTAAGSANITVCDQSSNCGTLYVTVTASASSSSLSFSPTNPSVSVGQSATVNISGGTEYYVYSNSNPNAVSQSMNGSVLTVTGVSNGSATLNVCSTANACGSVYVTVGSSASQSVSFGTLNPSITVGQSTSIALSGGSSYFISSNSNATAIQASLSASTLTLYGANPGSASLGVCASSGGCNTLYVTVTSASVTTQTSQTSYANLLSEIQSMQGQLAQLLATIQTMATRLTQLASGIATSASNSSSASNTVTASQSDGYKFLNLLTVGSSGNDVSELQKRLSAEGFYSGSITGYYGSLTETAVKKYQAAHGVTQAGYVGPSTRALLNGQ